MECVRRNYSADADAVQRALCEADDPATTLMLFTVDPAHAPLSRVDGFVLVLDNGAARDKTRRFRVAALAVDARWRGKSVARQLLAHAEQRVQLPHTDKASYRFEARVRSRDRAAAACFRTNGYALLAVRAKRAFAQPRDDALLLQKTLVPSQ